MNPDAVKFVKQFFGQAKPVAAICHGPWMLVEAGAAKGRTITSRPSLKTDIQNADGTWVDKEVVVSYGVVTSRNPDDIPAAFNREMIELLSKGANASGKTDRQAA
jgi:protease I